MPGGEVIYVSWNGVHEPLVHSQVLQYLGALRQHGWRFHLITVESGHAALDEAPEALQSAGVQWHPVRRGRFCVAGLWWSVRRRVEALIEEFNPVLVHARSFLSAWAAQSPTHRAQVPLLYDMRGFWVAEKVYKGSLKDGSWLHRWLTRREMRLAAEADGLVSLTARAIEAMADWPTVQQRALPPHRVIPTCVNDALFAPRGPALPRIVCLGSVGEGYLGDAVFRLFACAQRNHPEHQLLLITHSQDALIHDLAERHGVDLDALKVLRLPHPAVPVELGRGGVGLSLIKPHFSKQASCPTKVGEYLASGMPVLCNADIGDMDAVLGPAGVAVILEDLDEASLAKALRRAIELQQDVATRRQCRELAMRYFSLDGGVTQYADLYRQLESRA